MLKSFISNRPEEEELGELAKKSTLIIDKLLNRNQNPKIEIDNHYLENNKYTTPEKINFPLTFRKHGKAINENSSEKVDIIDKNQHNFDPSNNRKLSSLNQFEQNINTHLLNNENKNDENIQGNLQHQQIKDTFTSSENMQLNKRNWDKNYFPYFKNK